jgi:Tetratricopeptide repeat
LPYRNQDAGLVPKGGNGAGAAGELFAFQAHSWERRSSRPRHRQPSNRGKERAISGDVAACLASISLRSQLRSKGCGNPLARPIGARYQGLSWLQGEQWPHGDLGDTMRPFCCAVRSMLIDLKQVLMRNPSRIEVLRMQISPGSPNEAGRLLDLGVQLAGQQRLQEAIQIWQTVLELDPANVQAYQNLGAAFSQLGHLDEAKSFLRRALELRPDQPEACFNLANIIWKSSSEGPSRESETIALLRHAIQIRPNFIEAHYKLGSVLIECGSHGDAAKVLRQAFRLCLPADERTTFPEAGHLGAEGPITTESLSFRPMHRLMASICNQLGVV